MPTRTRNVIWINSAIVTAFLTLAGFLFTNMQEQIREARSEKQAVEFQYNALLWKLLENDGIMP
jgi:hypothetical protein